MVDEMTGMKDELGIPEDMRSCHTSMVDDYFLEGHIPIEAITKLLEERPTIDGLALPGMPPGSPGMSGEKVGPFTIYAVVGGRVSEFATI